MTENTAVTLNLGLPNLSTVVYAKQNDRLARHIVATLVDGSAAWTPPAGSAAIIRYLKPDGTGGFYDTDENEDPAVSISGNVATLTIAEQALVVPGNVYMELNFYTGSGEKVTTFTWLLVVKESVLNDAVITSSDYFNVLTEAIAEGAEVAQALTFPVPIENGGTAASTAAGARANLGIGAPSSSLPLMNGVAASGSSLDYSRKDHVHPSDTAKLDASYAPVRFSGTISSFPFTISNAAIKVGMEPVRITLGSPIAVISNIGWAVSAGTLTLTGTLAASASTTVEIILAKTDNAVSSGTLTESAWAIRTVSLVTSQTVSSSGTTALNTYSSRKFSDYDLIIFKCGTAQKEWRVSQTLPSSMWASGASVYLTSAHGASLENVSGMVIGYSSDTQAVASLTGAGSFDEVQIFGVKIG